ncbi:TMEM43 family protein [Dyella sp.]|uniref:TMEM43 family protein n=1 Tax=Dyella sp. TaxID=1869338 RepID=UPI002ED4EA48
MSPGRLGELNSSLWIQRGIAAVLLLAGLGLVAMTEKHMVAQSAAVGRHGGKILDLGGDGRVEAGQYGHMVRVAGKPQVIEAPYDPDFNQHANVPVLVRHVEMFQWREVRIGDQVHYEVDWVDHPVDASKFAQPGGHANPGAFPIEGKQFDAGLVRMNGLALSATLLHALPGSQPLEPDTKSMPANMAATFTLHEGHLVTSAKPDHPRLGDIRVSWEVVPSQVVTIFARVDGDRLVPAQGAADGKGYEVQIDDRSLDEVLPDVPEAPAFVWPRRIAALLLGIVGAFFALQGRRREPLLALGIGVAAVAAVACVCWLGEDLAATADWLVASLAGVALAAWRVMKPAI